MNPDIIIRNAVAADIPAVIGLVIALAVFEKEPDAVSSTQDDYLSALADGRIDITVAESEGTIVGMAIYYDSFSTWKGRMLYLEDFYVQPARRGQGIGATLFQHVIDEATRRGCVLLKWQVLDWNTKAIDFYKSFDAEIETGWLNGKLWLDK